MGCGAGQQIITEGIFRLVFDNLSLLVFDNLSTFFTGLARRISPWALRINLQAVCLTVVSTVTGAKFACGGCIGWRTAVVPSWLKYVTFLK